MGRIRLSQAVLVEGKYDKIKLESVVDALILTCDGFRIYKDREQKELLRSLAKTCGLIVLTDSDRAGFQIRGYLSGLVGNEGITHVYIPDIFGKERRKRVGSAEGKLGVEGMDPKILEEAFRKAGVLEATQKQKPADETITRQDLYEDGFTGGPGSAQRRRKLYEKLGLPGRLSTSSALEVLNQILTRQEYQELILTLEEE